MTANDFYKSAIDEMKGIVYFASVEGLIADLTPDRATEKPAGSPYSIATVTWHAWFWNNAWCKMIRGEADPFEGWDPDSTWPEIQASEWVDARERFLASVSAASDLAASEDPERLLWGEETVGTNLLHISAHASYHLGQIALLRQQLGLWPPASL